MDVTGVRRFSKTAAQLVEGGGSSSRLSTAKGAQSSAKAFDLIRRLPMGASSSPSVPSKPASTTRAPSRIRRPQGNSLQSQNSPSRSGSAGNSRGLAQLNSLDRDQASVIASRDRRGTSRSNIIDEDGEDDDEDYEDDEDDDEDDEDDDEDDEDGEGEGGEDEDEPLSSFDSLTDDRTIDRFTSLSEARGYAKIQDFIDDYIERAEMIDELEERAKEDKQLDDEYATALQGVREAMDTDIKDALEFTVQLDEAALPRHEPKEVELEGRKGEVGGATIGSAGMANAIEEGLRYVAKRTGIQGTHYIAEKELARRLVAGEFVKFRHPPEKREVLRIAENLGYKPDTPKGESHVGFESPNDEARKLMVRRLVQGRYHDPQDATLPNNLLKSVARITGGNASYSSEQKATLLKTIRGLLPAERQAAQRPAQRRR